MHAAPPPPGPNTPISPEGSADHQAVTPLPCPQLLAATAWPASLGWLSLASHLHGALFLWGCCHSGSVCKAHPCCKQVQSAAPGHGEKCPFPGGLSRGHLGGSSWGSVRCHRCWCAGVHVPVFKDLRCIPRGQWGVLGNSVCFCEEPPNCFPQQLYLYIPPAAYQGL